MIDAFIAGDGRRAETIARRHIETFQGMTMERLRESFQRGGIVAAVHGGGASPMSAAISPAISLRSVAKNFGTLKVLDHISFDVAQGEIVALLGTSGCGKSTLLNMVAGLLEASEGELWIDGKRSEGTKDRNALSYMFQEDRLLPVAHGACECRVRP